MSLKRKFPISLSRSKRACHWSKPGLSPDNVVSPARISQVYYCPNLEELTGMPQTKQSGRVSVVTGGSGGMGKACARLLSKQGAVIITDVRERELEAAAAELRGGGHEATAAVCDVSNAQSVAALAQMAAAAGQVQALVHTAGLSPTMADWRRIMNVNLVGSALIEQAFAPLMAAGGAAVFIASMAGHTAPHGAALYSV